jgi:hypothetical protein
MLASTVAYGRIALICGVLAGSWTVPLVRTRAASSHLKPSVARAIGRARKPGSRGRVIARPGSCAGRYSGCRARRAVPLWRRDRDLVGGQRHLCRGGVLLQPVVPSSARDRHDPWVLGQQPCQRDLSRRSALHLGELGEVAVVRQDHGIAVAVRDEHRQLQAADQPVGRAPARRFRPVTEAPSHRDLEVLRASPDTGTPLAEDHTQ